MSLIAWLPLNGNIIDKTGNYTFTNSNATIVEDRVKYKDCYSFNGSNAYISANMPISQYMTFCLWVKFIGSGSYHVIDFRTASSASVGIQPFYGGISYGLQVYSTAGGSYTYSAATCNFTTNTWYHVAIIYTPTYCELFIDGVSKGQKSGTFTNANLGTQSFRLGTRASGANWFNGRISDVQVYNNVLTENEINYIKNKNNPINLENENKLIHLTFNDPDFSITNKMYNCGYINSAFTTSGITKSTDTIIGDAAASMTSGYLNTQFSSAILTSTSKFSVACWFKQTTTSAGNRCLFSMRTGTGTGPAIFIISGNTIRFDTVNSNFSVSLSNPYNNWHHVVCTYDGTNRKIYIDGTLAGTNATSSIGGVAASLSIGQSGTTGLPNGNPFIGNIADWRLYDIALTADDVTELYKTKGRIFKDGTLQTNYFQDNSSDIILPDKKGNVKCGYYIEGTSQVQLYKTDKKIKCKEIEEE